MQVEVKKAEPRDAKLVADCHFDSDSLVIETGDVSGATAAAAAGNADNDNNDAVVSKPVTGTI